MDDDDGDELTEGERRTTTRETETREKDNEGNKSSSRPQITEESRESFVSLTESNKFENETYLSLTIIDKSLSWLRILLFASRHLVALVVRLQAACCCLWSKSR